MKGQLAARITIASVSVQVQSGVGTMLTGKESQEAYQLRDGGWLQKTCRTSYEKPRAPGFLSTWKMWQKFILAEGILNFSLSYVHRRVQQIHPAGGRIRQSPEWTLFMEIPRTGRSPHLFVRTFQRRLINSRPLMAQIRAIAAIPEQVAEEPPDSPVLIPGDLLLDWLGSALDHLPQRPADRGRWFVRNGSANWLDTLTITPPEEDDGEPVYRSMVAKTFRFVPHQPQARPETIFQAVCYDADSGSLTCRRGDYWRTIRLDQPLYRLFGKAVFTERDHEVVIKGNRVILPDAILFCET